MHIEDTERLVTEIEMPKIASNGEEKINIQQLFTILPFLTSSVPAGIYGSYLSSSPGLGWRQAYEMH